MDILGSTNVGKSEGEMHILAVTGIDLNIEYSITKGLKQISYVRSPYRVYRETVGVRWKVTA